MLLDDPFGNSQPQSCPFPFGGEEGLKNLLLQFSGNAASRILKRDGNGLFLHVMARLDRYVPTLPNRLGGVKQKVQKHLLKLLRIADNLR